MRTINLAGANRALTNLHNQVGADRFAEAKEEWLKSVVVVDDENGDPLPVDKLDIEVKTKDGEAAVEASAIVKVGDMEAAFERAFTKALGARPKNPLGIEGDATPPVRARHGTVKNFAGRTQSERAEKAYKFGTFLAAVAGKSWAQRRIADWGIKLRTSEGEIVNKAAGETVNVYGGFTVPEEYSNDIIDLRDSYGVFRRYSRIRPMSRDIIHISRRTGGLTAYFVAESGAGTESTKAWDRVSLAAQKLMCLTTSSNELLEDSIINVADDVAQEIAYAFATKEDQCGFVGDATSTYGGMTGVAQKIVDVAGTTPTAGGMVLTASTTWATVTAAEIAQLIGTLRAFAFPKARFFCSTAFAWQVLGRLQLAAGGATMRETAAGPEFMYAGFPITVSEVLPTSDTASVVALLFGDLSMATSMGTRREVSIAQNVGALNTFEQDEIAFRGTERFQIVCHDVGTATVAGPMVGLIVA